MLIALYLVIVGFVVGLSGYVLYTRSNRELLISYIGGVSNGMAVVVVDAYDPDSHTGPSWLGGRWGVIDITNGYEIIPFGKYCDIRFVFDSMAAVRLNENWGIIDIVDGHEVIPFGRYNHIGSGANGFINVWQDSLAGVIEIENDTVVIPFGIYSTIRFISSDMVAVMKNDEWGIIDIMYQREIIPFGKYDKFYGHLQDDNIAALLDGYWGVINILNGEEILPFEYESIRLIPNEMALVRERQGRQIPYGIININSKEEIISFGEYNLFGYYQDGMMTVLSTALVKAGVIDIVSGDVIIPFGKYRWILLYPDGVIATSNGPFFWEFQTLPYEGGYEGGGR